MLPNGEEEALIGQGVEWEKCFYLPAADGATEGIPVKGPKGTAVGGVTVILSLWKGEIVWGGLGRPSAKRR